VKLSKESGRELLWLGVFGVAFGYLEAAVVVYLRTIFYPEGFVFPLEAITPAILGVEIGREAATLAMLLGPALAIGGSRSVKFARFLYAFGLWDIFFYVGLKCVLGWPGSLMTWDILFLIPLPWTSPVLAPALVAVFFVAAGAYGIVVRDVRTRPWQWLAGAAGGAVIFVTFLWNLGPSTTGGVPTYYPWPLFALGLASILAGFLGAVRSTASR
jgi:hypothetical protein